jgi:hypothetical protein
MDLNKKESENVIKIMESRVKLDKIYEVIWYNYYVKNHTYIWDCLDYIYKNDIDIDIIEFVELWKNKRLPIDQEEEAIELMYDLIPKE